MKSLKNHLDIKSLFLGAFLGALMMLCIAAASSSNRTEWEYKTVIHSVFVNAYGYLSDKNETSRMDLDRETKAGWELFSVQLLDWDKEKSFTDSRTKQYRVDASLVFRRVKSKGNPEK